MSEAKASVIVCMNPNGQTLMLRRSPTAKTQGWCLPGGMIEAGEFSYDTASRELKEETGIEVAPERLDYIANAISASGHIVDIYYCKLPDGYIKGVVLSSEHDGGAWLTKPENVYPLAGNTGMFLKTFYAVMQVRQEMKNERIG